MKYCTYRAFGRDVNVSITSELINSIRGVARKISFLIIILMCWLITVEHHLDDHTSTFTFFYHKERLFLEALCLAQLALTVIFFVLWLQIRLPLCLAKHARHKEEKAKESPHTQLYHVHEEESSNV